tara:strand:- start:7183 stop:8475 length:1293 start_codon:yes stop_codon:yes gene_type:complete
MSSPYDVAVLGAGVAGLTAAYRLRDLDVIVIDADSHVGGRTLSQQFDDGSWANFAAQYVSNDKLKVFELADELDLDLIPSGFHSDSSRVAGNDDLKRALAPWLEKLNDEMARPRPADAAELDGLTVAEWLEGAPDSVHDYFELWCGQLLFASNMETSLHGLMLVWGDQRVTPFTTEQVPRSNRGEVVFKGGTNTFTRALAKASGATIETETLVIAVEESEGLCRVVVEGPSGDRTIEARHVISALPGTVARDVIRHLPPAKVKALSRVRYGCNIATPISVLPEGQTVEPLPLVPSRHSAIYCSNDYVLRTPGDIARDGGCFHAYIHDSHARVVWDDDPASIRSGAWRSFAAAFPELADRVHHIGFKRWRHALPHRHAGRMADEEVLKASCGAIHFCGDYTWTSNMDGAARSGEAAAQRVRDTLSTSGNPT